MYRAVEVVPVCSQLLWGAPPGNDFRAALLSHVRGLLQQEGFPFPVVPEISSKVRIMMQNPRPGPGSRQPRKSEFGFGPGGALWWRAMPLRLRSASFRPAPVFQRLGLRDQSRKSLSCLSVSRLSSGWRTTFHLTWFGKLRMQIIGRRCHDGYDAQTQRQSPWGQCVEEVLVLRARYWHRLPGQYFMDVLESYLRLNQVSLRLRDQVLVRW